MKKLLMFLLVGIGAVLSVGVAKTQVAPVFGEIRANVPFEFYAGDTRFPAGNYIVKALNEMDPQVLAITTADGQITSLMMVHLSDKNVEAKTSELTFNKYGSRFFLSSIQVQGYSNASQLDKSHFEELIAEGEVPGASRQVPAQHKK